MSKANPDYFKKRHHKSVAASMAELANEEFERLGIDDKIDIDDILDEVERGPEQSETTDSGKGFLA